VAVGTLLKTRTRNIGFRVKVWVGLRVGSGLVDYERQEPRMQHLGFLAHPQKQVAETCKSLGFI
jgi:hypothetical protein